MNYISKLPGFFAKISLPVIAAVSMSFGISMTSCSTFKPSEFSVQGMSVIYPDYMDVTVPQGIAPLNFMYTGKVANPVTEFSAGDVRHTIRGREVSIPASKWKALCDAAVGGAISVKSSNPDTSWCIYVSPDKIDYGLNYRLIEPGYEVYSKMGIYERELATCNQRPLIENTEFNGCVNCHSYNRADPNDFSLHIRGMHGATLIRHGGETVAYNTKTPETIGSCVYPYWHPSGKYIAYSTNSTRQGFHVDSEKLIEVFDSASDMLIYDIENNSLVTNDSLSLPDYWETFPAFSPDGSTLYFCRAAKKEIPGGLKDVRYNLCSVSFDAESGRPGTDVRVLVDAEAEGYSISFPRPSHDGKYLIYTRSDYGNFSIWHHEADLYCLNLETGESRPMSEINSPDTESYHSFSSNGRWMVFSSRRDDGLFTRLYITHFDENGCATKPFMLPQKNPAEYYTKLFFSYNVPEFVSAPVEMSHHDNQRIIRSKERKQMSFRLYFFGKY